MKIIFLTYFLCSLSQVLWAQNIPIGTWRTHFSYRDALNVALTDNGAYCGGANSLFFVDLQDQSLNKLSKIDGLSKTEISDIAFHRTSATLVIAYGDGTIDLLQNGKITSIDAIANAPISGTRHVNHVVFNGNTAFLSSDFGVVVLDLEKAEVKEAYANLGPNGEIIKVRQAAILRDSLFLATEQGIMAGSLDPEVNLLDFTNWRRFGLSQGLPVTSSSGIAIFEGQAYTSFDNDGIYIYQGNNWERVNFELQDQVLALSEVEDGLIITLRDRLLHLKPDQQLTILKDTLYPKPQMALRDTRGLWIADSLHGLVTNVSGDLSSVFPSGPFSDSLSLVIQSGGFLFGLPPGYDRFRRPLRTSLGFYIFREGEWQNYNNSNEVNTLSLPVIHDLADVTFNLQNDNFYFASFGEGIFEWNLRGENQILDENTAGSTLVNNPTTGRNVFISSIETDSEGLVWSTNYGNPQPLHRYNPFDGSWDSFDTPFIAARFPLDMQIGENGDFWLRLDPNNGGGILVINPRSGLQKYLTDIAGQGGLPTRVVNDLIIDLQGQVWVGTGSGVALYAFPFDLLERSTVDASSVFIEGRPLLRDESISAIAVDGGNRKWIGTENGLWLFSEFGDSVIHNFTEENSPLPSNNILDVEVLGISGEVFIVTDLGAVSFRGTATTGTRNHQNVSIFPNPVTRDFSGYVGISGLVNNAVVKVADVRGQLVNELRAEGGTAAWNLADFQGRRVSSGVYLIYSSNADGSETFIGKIAVVN